MVEAGQKRLIELQQPDGGWAWQGNGQTHEMMTPYALFGLLAAEEAGYPCPNPNTIPRGMARLAQYLHQMGPQWDTLLKNPKEANAPRGVVNNALFCLWVAAMYPKHAKDAGIEMNPWFERLDHACGRAEMSDTGHALALELAVKYGYKLLADKSRGRTP